MAEKGLREAEYNWYAIKSGLGGNVPLNDHKTEYYSTQGFRSNASIVKPVTQLEWEWLQSLTGVASKELADMWDEAVTGAGFTPGKSIDENKRIYYNNV